MVVVSKTKGGRIDVKLRPAISNPETLSRPLVNVAWLWRGQVASTPEEGRLAPPEGRRPTFSNRRVPPKGFARTPRRGSTSRCFVADAVQESVVEHFGSCNMSWHFQGMLCSRIRAALCLSALCLQLISVWMASLFLPRLHNIHLFTHVILFHLTTFYVMFI